MPLGALRGASFSLPFAARTRQNRFRTIFANPLQIRRVNAVGYATREFTNTKYVGGLPFVNTSGQGLKLKDLVLMDGNEYAGAGTLSWYDMDKGGFKFLDWSLEVYADPDDEDPIPGAVGWIDSNTVGYPDFYDTLTFDPGKWFFIQPIDCTEPKVTAAGQLITTDSTKPTTGIQLTNTKYCAGNPLPIQTFLKDVVLMDGEDYAGAGTISWYDMTKGGFKFLDWSLEVYADPDDEDPIPGAVGWIDGNTVGYPADYDEIKFEVGAGFFIQPIDCVSPWIAFENPFFKD